jgi:hypothetical protein
LAYSGDPVRKVLDKALPHNGAVWRFRRQDIEHEIVLTDEEAGHLVALTHWEKILVRLLEPAMGH